MTRRSVRMAGLVVLGVCAPLVLGACSSDSKSDSEDTTTTTESASPAPDAGGAVNAGETIEVAEFSFTPGTTEIGVGEAVTFHNGGSSRHTVTPGIRTAGAADPWVSTTIRQGETFVVTLSEPGEYAYHCSIHPDRMQGSIVVAG